MCIRDRLLPYETIVKASEGDPEAVAAVLSHYAGYILSLIHISLVKRKLNTVKIIGR